MVDDVEVASVGAADDSIASALAAAFAESEKAQTAESEKDKEPAKDAAAEKDADAEGAEAKEAEAAEGDAKADKPAEPAKAEDEPAKEGEAPKPPAAWSKRDKEMFARVGDQQVQAWLLERSKAMEADYTRKTMAAADLRKEYEPVAALFAPHKEAMAQKNYTPHSLIQAWMNVEQRLAAGEESAVSVLQGLVAGYKIPVAKVAAALGLTAPAKAEAGEAKQDGAADIPLPPAVKAQLDALGKIQDRLDREDREKAERTRAAARAAEAEQERNITNFKEETDGKGNLTHPHFAEVESDMLNLALAARASGKQVPALAELYEKAVFANPATRAKVLAAQKQQDAEAQREAERKKAAAARKAGSSVTGSPSGGAGQSPGGKSTERSLRDELEANFAEQSAA